MSPTKALALAQVRDAAPLFAALGDETRMRLLVRLSSRGPESITALSAEADVSRQAITKHLAVLEDAGLLRGERRGRERIWSLEQRRLDEALDYLAKISRQWDDALARLKRLVEE
jgi:DNA-binding transcriptional ArsR family regulator